MRCSIDIIGLGGEGVLFFGSFINAKSAGTTKVSEGFLCASLRSLAFFAFYGFLNRCRITLKKLSRP